MTRAARNSRRGELLNFQAAIAMLHVPYRGSVPSLADLTGGHIQVTFDGITVVPPLLEGEKIRALPRGA